MIPKIIHYCWLSGDEFPPLINYCVKTWKKNLPEYQIVCWDKSRFDIESVPWVKESYEARKYAFASDYIRFYALYNYGGIYLDSDVEVLKTFTELLNNKSFIGYENVSGMLEPAIVGAEKGQLWCKKIMEYYEGKHFNSSTKKIAPEIVSDYFKITYQDFPNKPVDQPIYINNNSILLCPAVYFSPIKEDKDKNYNKINKDTIGNLRKNPNTYCIHRFNGAWVSPTKKMILDILYKIIGRKLIDRLLLKKRK